MTAGEDRAVIGWEPTDDGLDVWCGSYRGECSVCHKRRKVMGVVLGGICPGVMEQLCLPCWRSERRPA